MLISWHPGPCPALWSCPPRPAGHVNWGPRNMHLTARQGHGMDGLIGKSIGNHAFDFWPSIRGVLQTYHFGDGQADLWVSASNKQKEHPGLSKPHRLLSPASFTCIVRFYGAKKWVPYLCCSSGSWPWRGLKPWWIHLCWQLGTAYRIPVRHRTINCFTIATHVGMVLGDLQLRNS